MGSSPSRSSVRASKVTITSSSASINGGPFGSVGAVALAAITAAWDALAWDAAEGADACCAGAGEGAEVLRLRLREGSRRTRSS